MPRHDPGRDLIAVKPGHRLVDAESMPWRLVAKPLMPIWLLLALPGCAKPFICPDGAEPVWRKHQSDPELPVADVLACERDDGIRHGPFASWVGDRLFGAGHFQNGVLEGTSIVWDDNGQKWLLVDWHKGEMQSRSSWNSLGIKTSDVMQIRGEERSTHWFWYDSGAPKWKAELSAETFDGPFESWYESGHRKARGEYRDNHRQGAWTCWDESGTVSVEATYENGRVVSLSGDPDSQAAHECRSMQGGCKSLSPAEAPPAPQEGDRARHIASAGCR